MSNHANHIFLFKLFVFIEHLFRLRYSLDNTAGDFDPGHAHATRTNTPHLSKSIPPIFSFALSIFSFSISPLLYILVDHLFIDPLFTCASSCPCPFASSSLLSPSPFFSSLALSALHHSVLTLVVACSSSCRPRPALVAASRRLCSTPVLNASETLLRCRQRHRFRFPST